MDTRTKYFLCGLIIVVLCVASVAITRNVKHTGTAISAEPAKTVGPSTAAAKIVVFSDFQCPYCSMFAPIFRKIGESYPNDVQITFKHFPLKMHPWAIKAAEASECAADQQKFWEYHDKLFGEQQKWAEMENPVPTFKEYAKELGLDTAKFNACFDGDSKKTIVMANRAEGKKFMVDGTPTAILNLKKYIVSLDEKDIRQTIDETLKKAGKK
jgi:protein-disulfide isomerase